MISFYEEAYFALLMPSRRIETAIQRYAAKRNMNSIRKNIFDKYLVNGGVEAGPNMFSGGESSILRNTNKQDLGGKDSDC